MPELPLDLRKLQTVPGALDIIRYLYQLSDGVADADTMMDDLDMSERRFNKANRRLITNKYTQMRADYTYELTPKGLEGARTLIAFEAENAPEQTEQNGIKRQVMLAVPRNLVVGETSPLIIGFPSDAEFSQTTDIVLRLESVYADVGDLDEMLRLDVDSLRVETTIVPQRYNQARLKLRVFQLTNGGNELNECGGMYVDVVVLDAGDTGEMIAYSADLRFMAL